MKRLVALNRNSVLLPNSRADPAAFMPSLMLASSLLISATQTNASAQHGQLAHFDTIIIGPEGRYTFNKNGNILPHIYAGLGIGSLSVSATDLGGKLSGGPAARAGIGIDFRLMPRLRVGVSAGVSLMPTGITPSMGPPDYLGPGVPTDPGNTWSLRLGARGEFL